MTKMSDLVSVGDENKQLIFDLAHREFASYHLELASKNHNELNLVGALGHIRSAAQAMAFIDSEEKQIEKSLEEILFIEALLLLELGSEKEALTYFQEFLSSNILASSDARIFRYVAESLLIIYDQKVGLIKPSSEDMLLELVKEAIAIPNSALAKTILTKMIEDESVNIKYRKAAAEEIFHLVNIRTLLIENPIVEKAEKLLGKEISDRTAIRPDSVNLGKVKNDFSCKEAEAYHGPWELSEIRSKKKSTWIYAWNEKLKSLWVLEIMDEFPAELEKAKSITILSCEILGYKNCTNMEDVKFRQRIQLKDVVLGINEKRALPLW